jgi:hypothetical protein
MEQMEMEEEEKQQEAAKIRNTKMGKKPSSVSDASPNVTISSSSSSSRTTTTMRRRGVNVATGKLLVFLIKVSALEALRRASQAKCRPIWWSLQWLSIFQAPPFNWLQRWAPFRFLAQATQSFSKPMICLSMATALTNAYHDLQQEDSSEVLRRILSLSEPVGGEGDTNSNKLKAQDLAANYPSLDLLLQALDAEGIELPERMDNEEIDRFRLATAGDVSSFVARVKKTVRWRERYYFLSQADLKPWTHLVFWHHHDTLGHPMLIVRLGLAFSILTPSERPRFSQAVVSQVEYGVLNMTKEDDACLTVIMDCEGVSHVGFPLHMTKCCCVLVQDHFPMRLASLFLINLHPVLHQLANDIMEVLEPSTLEKVHMEGENYTGKLVKYMGGQEKVPSYLGGHCTCTSCKEQVCTKKELGEASTSSSVAHRRPRSQQQQQLKQVEEGDAEKEDKGSEENPLIEPPPSFATYTGMLRTIIVGLLMFWVFVAMVAGDEPLLQSSSSLHKTRPL